MSPDQLEIQNCLTRLEIEINTRMEAEEQEKARKEAEKSLLRGFIISGSPRMVPQALIPGWMQVVEE